MRNRTIFAVVFLATLALCWTIELANGGAGATSVDPLRAVRYVLFFVGSLVVAAASVWSSNHA